MNLTDPIEIKQIMQKFGKRFSKSLGQNFLTDSAVIDASVESARLGDGDVAFEIGPGIGVLTAALAENAQKVVTVEIDRQLISVLEYTLEAYSNITVINGDFMKLDLETLAKTHFGGKKAKVVANLPYYITTPVLVRLLEYKHLFSSITILVQKEVALRMAASPGTKDYGMLSLLVQYHTAPEVVKIVPPQSFMPPPKVSSAVISLEILPQPAAAPQNPGFMFRVIKASFAQRRKTLANGLSGGGIGVLRETAQQAIEEMGFDAAIRGERLSLEQFAQLSDILYEKVSKK